MTFSQIPEGFKLFRTRAAVVPFEVAIGFLSMWTGTISFFDITVAARALKTGMPIGVLNAFNLLYLLAGAFIVAGVGWGYRNVEASGMVLLLTTLMVRVATFIFVIGFAPDTTAAIVQGLVFGIASGIRLVSLLRNKVLVLTEVTPDSNGNGHHVKPKAAV